MRRKRVIRKRALDTARNFCYSAYEKTIIQIYVQSPSARSASFGAQTRGASLFYVFPLHTFIALFSFPLPRPAHTRAHTHARTHPGAKWMSFPTARRDEGADIATCTHAHTHTHTRHAETDKTFEGPARIYTNTEVFTLLKTTVDGILSW